MGLAKSKIVKVGVFPDSYERCWMLDVGCADRKKTSDSSKTLHPASQKVRYLPCFMF